MKTKIICLKYECFLLYILFVLVIHFSRFSQYSFVQLPISLCIISIKLIHLILTVISFFLSVSFSFFLSLSAYAP